MATGERLSRRGDDLGELRDHYNELCHALTLSAGTNAAAADRLVAELQGLAQQIAAGALRGEAAAAPALLQDPAVAGGCCPHRASNVVAFRLKVRGSAPENPRLPAALNALTNAYPGAGANAIAAHARPISPARTAPTTSAAPALQELSRSVARQGGEIESLARHLESSRTLLERLEGRLAGNPSAQGLVTEVAALRSAAARQGQQVIALAAAVHRLAKLLAAGSGPRGS